MPNEVNVNTQVWSTENKLSDQNIMKKFSYFLSKFYYVFPGPGMV